jgi:hypothetical protein
VTKGASVSAADGALQVCTATKQTKERRRAVPMNMSSQVAEPVVVCPKCKQQFPLSKALTGPIEAQVAQRLQGEYDKRERQREQDVERRVAEAAAQEAKKAKAQQATEVKALRDQVTEQNEAIAKLQAEEVAQRKRARDIEAREKALALETERRVDAALKAAVAAATEQALEQHRLKDAEKDKQLADVRHQLEEAQRKAQQGSQQIQGEVAELDLESQLRQAFPQDQFEAVASGQRGADILQRVVDQRGSVAGTIIWERKNAKHFAETWLPKLREDQRANHADIAVLVPTTLPSDIRVFGQRQGVWIAASTVVNSLAIALRSGLLAVSHARVVADGQVGKQTALVEYVGGVEFRQRVESVLEPVVALADDLEKEKRSLESAWARREKRHEQIVRGAAGLWGDVSGIVGTLAPPKQLQLPPAKEDEKDAV